MRRLVRATGLAAALAVVLGAAPAVAAAVPAYVGQISDPAGVAPLYPAGAVADAAGNTYVADSGGDRVVKIDASGGQSTVSSGGYNRPRDVALDTDAGRLWVADTTDNQLVLITTAGATVRTLGGIGLKAPFGIFADATHLYVADTYNQRIVKVDKVTGARAWAQTACNGAFYRPRDVTVGSDGAVYVADTSHDRIAVLNATTGACVRVLPGTFGSPRSLASDGSGGLFVAEAHSQRLQHIRNDGTSISRTTVPSGNGPGQFNAPACVYTRGGVVGVCDTFNFAILRFAEAGNLLGYVDSIGGTPPAPGGFNQPFGVAYGPAGEMYVSDMFNHRVQKFAPNGSFERQWGGFGTAPGQMQFPRGISVSPDGQTVVLTNSENDRIDLYRPDGSLIRSVRSIGDTTGWPHQVVLAPDGTFWLADTNRNRVLHLGSTGTVLGQFTNGGKIKAPRGIAMDTSGDLYVSNSGVSRIEKYSQSGLLLGTLATPGNGPANVRVPWNLHITGTGTGARLYVADGNNDRVVVLGLDGTPMSTFGTSGTGPGRLDDPRSVAVDPVSGRIAVADFVNDRISLWQ